MKHKYEKYKGYQIWLDKEIPQDQPYWLKWSIQIDRDIFGNLAKEKDWPLFTELEFAKHYIDLELTRGEEK